jgi:RNA 3'-terminal phosphate cyclase
MILAGAGRLSHWPISRHTTTNIGVIAHFVEIAIDQFEEQKRVRTVCLIRKLHEAMARPQ